MSHELWVFISQNNNILSKSMRQKCEGLLMPQKYFHHLKCEEAPCLGLGHVEKRKYHWQMRESKLGSGILSPIQAPKWGGQSSHSPGRSRTLEPRMTLRLSTNLPISGDLLETLEKALVSSLLDPSAHSTVVDNHVTASSALCTGWTQPGTPCFATNCCQSKNVHL